MSSNQRSQGSKQSNKGANEKVSRSTTADKGNLRPDQQSQQSQQSGNKSGQQQGGQQQGSRQQQTEPGQRQSNDLAGGMPRSPGGSRQSAEQDMDEDTGLSNRANRQSSEIDEGSRQSKQSNVGRRDDGTPD